ncbi:MAG: ABC transporter substrate binding protein [Nitrospiraceae bacterium]|nr:ABC transporter substrate binding protein [Nitrospiraceae bacterium]
MRKKLLICFFLIVGLLLRAGTSKAGTVGVIITRGSAFYEEIHSELAKNIARKDGNVKFIVQRPYPDVVSWSNAARKLIAADVDAIVAYGAAAASAVLRERPGVPVIYAGVYGPAAHQLKGRNLAGVYSPTPIASLLRYLRDTRQFETLGVIYNSLEEDSLSQFDELMVIGRKYGMKVAGINLRRSPDIASILASVRVDALYVTGCATAGAAYPTILNMTEYRKMPMVSLLYDKQKRAPIMLTPDPAEQGAAAADLLLKALRRSSADGLGKVEGRRYLLIYNYRNSTSVGMRMSTGLVTDATEVIY